MSVKGKLHRLLRASPFWSDLADAINTEMILLRSELITPQKNFFEPRTLTTFEDLRSFLVDHFGFSPYTELFYQKTLPAIFETFPSVLTSYPNQGWKGRPEYDGNSDIPSATATGVFTQTIPGLLHFAGIGEYLSFSSPLTIDVRRGSILFNFMPASTAVTKYVVLRHPTLLTTGYVGIQTTGIVLRLDDGTAEVSVPFLTTLQPNTIYRIGIRLRQGHVEVFLNGALQGSVIPAFTSTGSLTLQDVGLANTNLPALVGDLGNLKVFVESLSDQDFALEYAGVDINASSVRLNQADPLKFIRHECEGLGYRVRNRGNRLFYTWVLNKARMEGQVYPLFRDVGSNLLLKSLVLPTQDKVAALDTMAPAPYFSQADDLSLSYNFDTGWTLDAGMSLDQNRLGKNVAFTRHFALEMVLGQTRDDYGNSGFARFTAHDLDQQVLFLQKHLDYLTQEARYGKSTVEFPHVGVQLRLACHKSDTVARMDPSTRWTTQVQAAFPASAPNWADTTLVDTTYASLLVYSGATLLYHRAVLDTEIERTSSFHLLNLMIPAKTIYPTTLGPGDGTTTSFGPVTLNSPIPGTIYITYQDTGGVNREMRDDGNGHLFFTDITPDLNHFSGSVNYTTGAMTVLTALTGAPSRTLKAATYITVMYKTAANLPITQIKIQNSTAQDVLIVDSGNEPKLYFWKPENHLALVLTIDLLG